MQTPHAYQPIATQETSSRSSYSSGSFRGHGHGRDRTLAEEVADDAEAHAGVSTIEATQKVYGRYSRWTLYISLGLASFIYSLDGSTTYNYLWIATSSFGQHSLISSVQVAQSITLAVGKPIIAKVADVSSRGTAYFVVLVFYVLGYLIIAASQGVVSIIIGIIFYALGYTGLQVLTAIIIADITTLKWRGIISSLSTTPFIVNAVLGSIISSWFIEHSTWRMGYLMFAALVPISLAPLIFTLLWAEQRAKQRNLIRPVSTHSHRASLSLSHDLSQSHDSVLSRRHDSVRLSTSPTSSPTSRRFSRSIHDHSVPRLRSPTSRSQLLPTPTPRARRESMFSSISMRPDLTWGKWMLHLAHQLDAVGLVLLGLSISFILFPLTVAGNAKVEPAPAGDGNGTAFTSTSTSTLLTDDSLIPFLRAQTQTRPTTAFQRPTTAFQNPAMLGLLLTGLAIAPVFFVWEAKYARRPVIPGRFWRNRSVVGASVVGAFDFASFYLTYTYLMSFVLVVKPWSLVNAAYFNQIQTIAMTVAGIGGGVLMRVFRRYKYILVGGLILRICGVTLMLYTRSSTSSDFALILTQVLQGVGGGFAAISSSVGAQASVPHADLAGFMAALLLFAEVGGAGGSAIAGAIWSNQMPERLAHYLPQLSDKERHELFGSVEKAAERPRGDPVREGVILAYADVMYSMVLLATFLSIVPLLASLLMPNWYLGDNQNAVEQVDVGGDALGLGESESESEDDGMGWSDDDEVEQTRGREDAVGREGERRERRGSVDVLPA